MRLHLPSLRRVARQAARTATAVSVLAIPACVRASPSAGPYPGLAEFSGREVESVEVVGEMVVPSDSLSSILATRASRCRIPFLPFIKVCFWGYGRETHTLDLAELARDVTRIQLFHRDHGYYGTSVTPTVEPVGDGEVAVRFGIIPGDQVVTRTVEVQGTEGIITAAEVERKLPIQEGEPFRRRGFLASADTVRAALLREGYAYAQVLRNYAIDTIADVAEAEFGAIPGPLVRVDTILVLGNDRLPRRTILRQLAVRDGDILVASRLNQSQRNLYDLGLISFASVQLAPDSLQVSPDSARATVVVRVVEAPRYLAEASGGYGTLDCLRTQGRVVDRNFLGGARRLEVTGSLSKIGAGEPLDGGLRDNLCKQLQEDSIFSDTLNYRVAATVTQPRLFGTRTSTTLAVHAEKLSEFRRYLRVSRGAQLSVAREVAPQTLVTSSVNVQRGRTNAEDVFFCIILTVCQESEIDVLRDSRWSNSVGVAAVRDRSRFETFTVGGYQARATVDFASAILGSDDRYLRLFGDLSAYRELRPRWVLAGRLLGGTFLQGGFGETGFIPPERLFYGGGPNTVRGLERNSLGPTVYVTSAEIAPGDSVFSGDDDDVEIAATGGTRIVVGSLELRIPSPILAQNLRFATFVDAGRVSSDTVPGPWRLTPGAGVRYVSPVGAIRVDLGFNPYRSEEGPLFGFDDATGELIPLGRYRRPEPKNFLDRFQIYIAVGQAF